MGAQVQPFLQILGICFVFFFFPALLQMMVFHCQPNAPRQRVARAVAIMAAIAFVIRFSDFAYLSIEPPSTRRSIIKGGAAAMLAASIGAPAAKGYELMPLPYQYDALEPSIDRLTMEIHHDRHHQTYINKINKVLEGMEQPPLVKLQKKAIRAGTDVRNNAGGAYNHNMFWMELAKTGTGGKPEGELLAAINMFFGSFEEFKSKFEAASAPGARFGSGWVWLVVRADGLHITSTPDQDNPLMLGVDALEGIPILGLDVWEHAYYLKYQQNRPTYVKAWWDVVNWNQVSAWYLDAVQGMAPILEIAFYYR